MWVFFSECERKLLREREFCTFVFVRVCLLCERVHAFELALVGLCICIHFKVCASSCCI